MKLTGAQIAEICANEIRCCGCPLQEYKDSICAVLIVDIKLARVPTDIHDINKRVFEVKKDFEIPTKRVYRKLPIINGKGVRDNEG